MRVFEANITNSVIDFFENTKTLLLKIINAELEIICGIKDFFNSQIEIDELSEILSTNKSIVSEPDRTEYGDFQTNNKLSDNVCKFLKKQNVSPEIIIEPTCGKGNFIISCLNTFNNVKFIYGVEIYKPYVWETKFAIFNHFLNNRSDNIPEINIIHHNVFDYSFNEISTKHRNKKILIIGNPPWVTNSKLSLLGSGNLPTKSNFKNHNGFDAITGKGNFDIGEYISLQLLSIFSNHNGKFAFLVKNSVVKNILIEQNRKQYKISNIKQFDIDAKKEFNVSVNACLLYCSFGTDTHFSIKEYDFYSNKYLREYGWVNNKFVADVEFYKKTEQIEGKFSFEWRQGVKHDSSKIMELEIVNGHFINNKKETVEIENDLVYGLLKSSDLKGNVINKPRKYTIITQKKIGQETKYIKEKYQKTYNYLFNNIEHFNKRKSSIYKGKPLFSIFGIGNYSFKLYKVAISGMYKTTKFSLVTPYNDKPIMLDDTCYFIGFDTLIEAKITQFLLNKDIAQHFIHSIAFADAKRMITKDLLMRINLTEIIKNTNFVELKTQIESITKSDWVNYKSRLNEKDFNKNQQLELFTEKNHQ